MGPADSEVQAVILIGGDSQGSLGPCGCTKPMVGGIKRRATAAKQLGIPGKTIHLDMGGFFGGLDRQADMKAETLAQSLKAMKVDAVLLTEADARRAPTTVESLRRLSGAPWLDGSLNVITRSGLTIVGGPPNKISADGVPALALVDGDAAAARRLAEREPSILVAAYHSHGSPSPEPTIVGDTWLASPGDQGKALLRIEVENNRPVRYAVIELGEEFKDDPAVARIYKTYLERVSDEKLLEKVPRSRGEAFAGTAACRSCHEDAHRVWEGSEHARAYTTLEREGHAFDPECVGCHVVGLRDESGFRSKTATPSLTHVGCESCHGPAAAHVHSPAENRLQKVTEKTCLSCHNGVQSPHFNFSEAWPKIKH